MRLLFDRIPHVRSFAAGLFVEAGSRDEQAAKAGLTHLLEHMLFRGTELRSGRGLSEAVDGLGAELNAFTTREHICLLARGIDTRFEAVIRLLAEVWQLPALAGTDLELERRVVLQELTAYAEDGEDLAQDLFMAAAWPGHGLGRGVLGAPQTVAAITIDDLRCRHAQVRGTRGAVLSIAGNVDEAAVELVAEVFQANGPGDSRPLQPPVFSPGACGRVVAGEQVHLCLGGLGAPAGHPDLYALEVLGCLLGGGPSSRLFTQVREERGYAYDIYAHPIACLDGGLFMVSTACGLAEARDVTAIISDALADIAAGGASADELSRAKTQLEADVLMGLESPHHRMQRAAQDELYMGREVPGGRVPGRAGSGVPGRCGAGRRACG